MPSGKSSSTSPDEPRWRLCPSTDVTAAERAELWRLWQAAFDGVHGFDRDDEAHAYGGTHALALAGGRVVAHASVIMRELTVGGRVWRSGYVEGVAVLPGWQGRGLGAAAMRALDPVVRSYELGMLSTGRARGFYDRLGWEEWQGRSFVLRAGARVATDDEQGCLMALRFGPGAGLDLSGDIVCRDRPGDAW